MFLEYIGISSSLLFQPTKAVDRLFFRFREDLLKYGFMTFMIGSMIYAISVLLVNPGFTGFTISQLIIRLFWFSLISLAFSLIHIAIIYLLLGLFNKKVELRSMSGLFLSADFPLIVLLPLALIFKAIPELSASFFYFLSFLLLIMIFYLKVKALVRTSDLQEINAAALMFLPSVVIVILTVLSFIALLSSIA